MVASLIQPIVSDEVAAAVLTDITLATPQNTIVEVAGPEKFRHSMRSFSGT